MLWGPTPRQPLALPEDLGVAHHLLADRAGERREGDLREEDRSVRPLKTLYCCRWPTPCVDKVREGSGVKRPQLPGRPPRRGRGGSLAARSGRCSPGSEGKPQTRRPHSPPLTRISPKNHRSFSPSSSSSTPDPSVAAAATESTTATAARARNKSRTSRPARGSIGGKARPGSRRLLVATLAPKLGACAIC